MSTLALATDAPTIAPPAWWARLVELDPDSGSDPPDPPDEPDEPHRWDDDRWLMILLGLQVLAIFMAALCAVLDGRGWVDSGLGRLWRHAPS